MSDDRKSYRRNATGETTMYDTLDEVPWNTVTSVTSPKGNTAAIDADGFAVWVSGPWTGKRIPLDASGPWTPKTGA
jgi:hypothetical protein